MNILTPEQADLILNSLNLSAYFFDEREESYNLLKEQNPELLKAYEALYSIADEDY